VKPEYVIKCHRGELESNGKKLQTLKYSDPKLRSRESNIALA